MSVPIQAQEPDAFREACDAALDVVTKRIRYWANRRERSGVRAGMVETELVAIELELHALRRRGVRV